jgi:hypothetical protein
MTSHSPGCSGNHAGYSGGVAEAKATYGMMSTSYLTLGAGTPLDAYLGQTAKATGYNTTAMYDTLATTVAQGNYGTNPNTVATNNTPTFQIGPTIDNRVAMPSSQNPTTQVAAQRDLMFNLIGSARSNTKEIPTQTLYN